MTGENQEHEMIKKVITITLLFYFGLMVQPECYAGTIAGKMISRVSLNKKVFNPSKGEDVQIKYRLSEQSYVKTGIYGPAGRLIRVIYDNEMKNTGYNTFVWDGKDEKGNLVPDEAYTYAIFTWDKNGRKTKYYPIETEGETLTLMDSGLNKENGDIEYVLPKAGRVRIRIGIDKGPLLLTLLDWAPRQAGKNAEKWDGKDSEGLRKVLEDGHMSVVVSVFSLPMNSIITEGNGSPLRVEDNRKNIAASEDILRQSNPDMLIKNDGFTVGGFLSHSFHKREECLEPEFSVKFPGQKKTGTSAPVLKGIVPVRIDLSDQDKRRLIGNRFEIKLYIDDLFIFEEEQGLSPYTYRWNTRGIGEGDHILTVNVIEAGGMDHIGTKSIRVRIGK